MRASILAFAFLLAGCDTSHMSEGIGPFKTPGAQAREAAAAARDPVTAIDVYAPRLTRDGKTILFSFRYGRYPMKLAMMPADPADKRVTILSMPPMMDWFEAAWGPDEKGFAVVSRCEGDKCYESAQGFNIWRAWLRPNDNLKRITADRPGIRRNSPVFGKDENELYWVIAERFTPSKNVHLDVNQRLLVRAPNEEAVYPSALTEHKAGAMFSDEMPNMSMNLAGWSVDGGLYFTSEVFASRGKSPLLPAVGKMHDSIPSVLFRYTDGVASLGRADPVDMAAVSRARTGIVSMRRLFVHGRPGQVSDFFLADAGRETPLFRFDSYAVAISASDALDTVAFAGTRGLYGQSSLWVWRKGDAAPVDLNVPERVKEQCDREIAAENARTPHP